MRLLLPVAVAYGIVLSGAILVHDLNPRRTECAFGADLDRRIATCTGLTDAWLISTRLRAEAFNGRGVAWKGLGYYDRAAADHNDAIRLDPGNALAFKNRGFIHRWNHDNDRAIADYDVAIRLDRTLSVAFTNRALAHARQGDYEQAFADYEVALRGDLDQARQLRPI